MPTAWLQRSSALVLSLFIPWFPISPPIPPEVEPSDVAGEVGVVGESLASTSASEDPLVLPGVVIEEIPKGSALEKAGLQVGDVILSWERLPNPPANPEGVQGALMSYFDWQELEVEQVPRGAVVLRGRRDAGLLELRVESGNWEAKVRPVLSRALEEIYLAGKAQLASGNTNAAVEAWRSVVEDVIGEGGGDLRAWMVLRIGEVWEEQGEWGAAVKVYRKGVQVAESRAARVKAWVALGKSYREINKYKAAELAYESALKVYREACPECLGISSVLTSLGIAAWANRELSLAHDYFQRALVIQEKLAPQSLALAVSLYNLGSVAWGRGQTKAAETYYLRALQIEQLVAPYSLEVASSINNMGTVLQFRGESAGARNYFLQALAIEEQLAPQSLDVARTLNNLGSTTQELGELERANSYYTRALHLFEKSAPRSLDTATCLNSLASLAYDRGELDLAHEYGYRALLIREHIAPNSREVAASLNILGLIADGRGELDRAESYYSRSFDILYKLAPEGLDVAASLNNLGDLARNRGDFEKALDYFERSLLIKKQVARRSLEVAVGLNNLGLLAQDRGELNSAREYHSRALEVSEQIAPESFDVAVSLENLCLLARDRGEFETAYEQCLRALQIRKRLAPRSLIVAHSFNTLASVALAVKDFNLALGYYSDALNALESQISRLGGSYKAQAGFRSQHRSYYLDLFDLLLAHNRLPDAFQVLERFRAQTFLTMLVERDVAFTADIPEELDRERRRLGFHYQRTLKKLYTAP